MNIVLNTLCVDFFHHSFCSICLIRQNSNWKKSELFAGWTLDLLIIEQLFFTVEFLEVVRHTDSFNANPKKIHKF